MAVLACQWHLSLHPDDSWVATLRADGVSRRFTCMSSHAEKN